MKTNTIAVLSALIFLALFLAGCLVPEEARTEIAKIVKLDLTQQLAKMVVDGLLTSDQLTMIVEALAAATAEATDKVLAAPVKMDADWERWGELAIAASAPFVGLTAASRIRRGVTLLTGAKKPAV